MEKDYTDEWREYQTGLDYLNRINYYNKTDLNWRFYNNDQWFGIKTNGLSKWTFNICESAINYFIAFLISQKIKLQYTAENIPDESEDPRELKIKEYTTLLSDMADMKWEKDKMDSLIKDLLLDGAVSGSMAAHVYWDSSIKTGQDEQGDFKTELVDSGNVMFGNPNNKSVEKQPYILIVNREVVSDLKKEAKLNGIPQDQIEWITSDAENNYQAGDRGKIELDNPGDNGKVLTLIKYWKKDGTVYWNKSTRYCAICKERNLGISRYPIAFGNWKSIKNSYIGMSSMDGLVDNQLSINQLFALVSYWMRMSAFGKTVYDGSAIDKWSNTIGVAVKADSAGGPISNVVHQLQAGNFNEAILTVIKLAIDYTREFIGANSNLLGSTDPTQASGVAIISTAKQAAMPLTNQSLSRDQFVEDLGLIWGEFFLKKYNNRKVAIKKNGKVVVVPYDANQIKDILLQCSVDVGPSQYWSELAGINALDRLLSEGHITKLQYFERVAKMNLIPDIQGLINDAKAELEQVKLQEDKELQFEQMAQFVESLPEEIQMQINQLPSNQKEQVIMQMMQQAV